MNAIIAGGKRGRPPKNKIPNKLVHLFNTMLKDFAPSAKGFRTAAMNLLIDAFKTQAEACKSCYHLYLDEYCYPHYDELLMKPDERNYDTKFKGL